MYESDATETSKGALVELCRALRQYRRDIVLAGGWAPYFLTLGHFDHCGSIDIDFVIRPEIVTRYERIKEIIERLGYEPTENVFRFEKQVASPRTGNRHTIELDFLTEPMGAERLPRDWLHTVQSDLKACIIEGSSIVFKHNLEIEVTATLPGDGEASENIPTADVMGSLTMKGLALHRMKDKDSYDIYAVAGYHEGNPSQAARAFSETVGREGGIESATTEAFREIKRAFASTTSQGPAAVARFTGNENDRVDSHQRLKVFLEILNQEYS